MNTISPASATTLPRRIHCVLADSAQGLSAGLKEIEQAFPHRFGGSEALQVHFEISDQTAATLAITADEASDQAAATPSISADEASGAFRVRCKDSAAAFRALGVLLGRLESGLPVVLKETRAFDTLGVMLDVSRNGVLSIDALRRLIRHMALMGINQLMLYTEDTYEIPEQPLFGYFRSRYTQEELRAIDDYAHCFGIEAIPCIQTLGHLEQVLKWTHFQPMRDIGGVLLSGDAKTDHFIEQMLAAASAPFRSKRIHIGMDEADGVGAGIYRVRNGARPAFEVLTEHLNRTTKTCRRLGLQPMIWSDMFFRLGSKTHDYYDPQAVISEQAVANVPEDTDFVYWDYYHNDPAFYSEWIARHRAMGKEPIYAGGVWTWNRWWTQLHHTFRTLRAGMSAARENHLKEAFVTLWGDDGMEVDLFSALPGIQFFAEMAYADPSEADVNLAAHLRGSSEINVEAWITAAELDLPPVADPEQFYHANPSKWLLWHDPLLNFLDQHIPESFTAHYAELSMRLTRAAQGGGTNARLAFPARIAEALALKCELHHALRPAYRAADKARLTQLLEQTIPQLRTVINTLRNEHEALWNELYRVFGWEALERRYAGLLARLDTLCRKLSAHLEDGTAIAELDCETIPLWEEKDFYNIAFCHYQLISGSCIN